MVRVFVCYKAESGRFQRKNDRLWEYTVVWLLRELADLPEEAQVYVVGDRPEFLRLPRGWEFIRTECVSHARDLQAAEDAVCGEGDVCVLVQLTQPLRRRGLLVDAVAEVRRVGRPAVSVAVLRDEPWRECAARLQKVRGEKRAVDGALYAWRRGESETVLYRWGECVRVDNTRELVDVDYRTDIPRWLDAAWAAELLAGMD